MDNTIIPDQGEAPAGGNNTSNNTSNNMNNNMNENNTGNEPKNNGAGPLIGVIIIIIILALGGLYFWKNSAAKKTSGGETDEVVDNLSALSAADDIASIESELESTDLENLDSELGDLENTLQ